MRLGGAQPARGGASVIARASGVSADAFEDGLYLRAVSYDVVTLDGFSRSRVEDIDRRRTVPIGPAPAQGRYEVTALPAVGDTLPLFGSVEAARALSGGGANPNIPVSIAGGNSLGELRSATPLRTAFRYEVVGGLARAGFIPESVRRPPRPLSPEERARFLALPASFDATLAALATQAAAPGRDARGRAEAIRRFLLQGYTYGVDVQRTDVEPVRDFLLKDRRGHCELFAAAFALLLRSQGIPARVVGGFQGGALDGDLIVFMERHAHAWVEWWLDDTGWIVDDATPMATGARDSLATYESLLDRTRRFWDDMVLDYSMNDQLETLARAQRSFRGAAGGAGTALWWLVTPVVAVALGLLVVILRRRWRSDGPDEHPLAREILAAVARNARTHVTASMTVREAVQRVPGPPVLVEALLDALGSYEQARFAGTPLDEATLRRHRRALRRASGGHQTPHPPLETNA